LNQELYGVLDQIIVLLGQRREDELKRLLSGLHPADMAEVLEELEDDQRTAVMQLISDETAAETIAEMEPEDQVSILKSIGTERAGDILEEMSADDVADMVGDLTDEQADQILDLMDVDEAVDVRELLEYRPDTAGGIMTTEYVALQDDLRTDEAIEELRRLATEVETTYYVYVVNERDQLVGVLSLRELIISLPETRVRDIMKRKLVSVRVDEDQELVVQAIQKYNLLAVPVVDEQNVLLGIVTVDDAMDVLEEEATEDIYRAAGVTREDLDADPNTSIWQTVRARLPLLLTLLFLSLVAGKVIQHFNSLITTVGALSVFIMTMAGGAGSAATQSLAVVARGLATGDIDRTQVWRVVWREIRVGFIIGVVCGVTLAVAAFLWQRDPWVGLIAGLAILVNLTLAKAVGTAVPLVLQGLRLDPSLASGPLIATVTDATSMLVYFGIASGFIRFIM